MRHFARLFLLSSLLLLSLAGISAERTTYYIPDAQGSPIAAMDEQGNLLWRESYAPYGERRVRPAANDAKNAYTGKPEDLDTGLVYMGARWYDPETARFTGIDPQGVSEGNPQSFGRYVYANNSPYRYVDPNGEAAVVIPLLINAAREGGSAAVEAATGVPVPFSMTGLSKAIAKNADEFAKYFKKAQTIDVSTGKDEAVFYSGKGARAEAEAMAAATGKKTLEMTPGGASLDADDLFGPNSPLTVDQATAVWAEASRRFAEQASGTAYGVLNNPRAGSIFNTVEFPALQRNKKITNVITGGK